MTGRLTVVSSDGHVGAEMEDYLDYLESRHHDAFADYVKVYRDLAGGRSTDLEPMSKKVGPEELADWRDNFLQTGRLDGYSDLGRRCAELDREGVAGEVVFPDFGVPFGPFPASASSWLSGEWRSSVEQVVAGFAAYNRWLVDFCSSASDRVFGQAGVVFQDPGRCISEIHWAKEHNLVGLVFILTADDRPIHDPEYDPVWAAAEEMDLPVNFHVAISTGIPSFPPSTRQSAALVQVATEVMDIAHKTLPALIWGGVMERHPRLKFVFTEQQSDWVIGQLARMDHSYRMSRIGGALRDAVPREPTEYFERQCYLGSSIFSRGEIRARYQIGVDKMMLGVDYPHYEGTFRHQTMEYFRATLGAECVPESEVRSMLGETCVEVFGLDGAGLARTAALIGPTYEEILRPPANYGMRCDVVRPLLTVG